MRFNNILTPPHLKEGYKIMPPMDKEKYPEMPGLEGPFTMMSGKVVYYDPKEGAYYDKDTDMYMSYDEFQQHDNDYSNMKDERDEVKKEADELNIGAKGDRPYKAPRQPKRGDPINVKSKGVDPKVLNMFLTNSMTEEQLKELSDKDRKEYYRLIKNPHPKRDPNMPNDPGYGGNLPPNKDPIYKPIPGSGMYPPKDPIYKPIPGSGRYPKYPGPEEIKTAKDLLQKARRNSKLMQDDVAVRRDGKTLSKGEKAKLQRQGVLMKEGGTKSVIDMIANADNPEEMVMDLVDRGDAIGKFLYSELEQLATEAGTTFNNAESMPEDFVDELLANMGIEGYTFEGAPKSSPRPKPRPKTMPRPKARPTTRIGGMPGGSTRGIDPKDNYSPEDLKRLLMQSAMSEMDGEITKDSVKKSALELLVDIAKTSKQYKGEITDDQVHYLGSLVHDFDMAGIETEKYSEIEKLFRTMADTERADMGMIQPAYAQAKKLDEEAGDEEEGMIVYVGDQKFEYADYTIQDAMYIVDEYADEMEGEPYEVYNADGKLVASGTMRSGAFHEPGIEEGDGRKKGIHPKGHPMRKKQQAAIHANEDVNQQYADILKSKNQIKINAFLQGLDPATATRLTGGKAQTSKISSDGQSIGPSGDTYKHGKPGLSKQTIRMTKPVADRKYGESKRRVSMNQVCEAVKQTDPTQAVAMYVRTTLDPSYKTWDQVHEQVKHILSCINEGKTVNANTVMQLLSRKNLQEKADKGMMLKENIDSLRKIVRDKQYQTIKFSDGSMKVDLTTASMFIQVYEKQKPETQAKMDEMLLKKSGFLKLLDVMYSKMS